MSQFHYIASPIELDVGNFGGNKIEIYQLDIINPYLIRINGSKEIKFPYQIELTTEELMSELEVYENEEDVAGIFVSHLPEESEIVRLQFFNPYVYKVSANWGSLIDDEALKKIDIDRYNVNLKCKEALFKYIKERIKQDIFIEFFSSWADEEGIERNKLQDRNVYFNDPKSINMLEIQDRQYIRFYLSKNIC